MTIIYADDSGPVKWPKSDRHDPDSEKFYQIDYYPSLRANSTRYTKGADVVVFSVDNGCMYECVSGGISDTSEIATVPTIEGENFADADVEWNCKSLTTLLGTGDTITTSTWSGDVGVVFSDDAIILGGKSTELKVIGIPENVTSFTITNEISITYSSGRTEVRNKSLIISVKEL